MQVEHVGRFVAPLELDEADPGSPRPIDGGPSPNPPKGAVVQCAAVAYWVGVDLGTTYSAAAVATGDRVEVVGLGTRSAVVPSVVVVRDDGSVLVGEAAERRAAAEPERAAREFKRRLGDPTPYVLGGVPYGAESLTAMLLRSIVDQVAEGQGERPTGVALTHPASWGPYKLDLLRLAAEQAGVGEAVLVPEPVGAAVHYATLERIAPGEVVAVYDFGGGTFDAAVLRRTEGSFEVIGTPVGLERLGGIDVDEAVLRHVDAGLGGAVTELDPADPAATAAAGRLRVDCQLAKEALSDDTDTTIPVALPNLSTEVRLTRSELESMIRPRLDDTIDALRRSVASAGLDLDGVGRVLLVGGTSRMPVVRQAVREATGRPVSVDAHPKHAVSSGAAAVARRLATPAPGPATAATPPSVPPAVPVTAEVAPAVDDGARRRRRGVLVGVLALAVVGAVAAVLLLGGGDGDGDGELATDATTTTTGDAPSSTAEAAATTAARAGVEAGDLDLPRTLRYGDLDITVEAVEVDAGGEGVPAVARLTASVTNPLEQATVYLSFATVELVVGDDVLRGTASAGPGVANPGDTVAAEYEFPLGDLDPAGLDLGGAVLRFADAGDEPGELPLGGAPAPDAPSGEVGVPAELAVPEGNLVFRFTSGTVSLDKGTDVAANVDTASRRAAEGSGFVRLVGTATGRCQVGCPGGVLATSGIATLVVDGSAARPAELTFNEVLVDGQTIDIELVWEVPLGAGSYVLRAVANSAAAPVDAPVEVPEL